ncbi:hypothetical protein HCG51_32925 [Tolypothrix sp. PCC 7910]|uniref:hypothetical protein n=1 Tax=Tolypothrix sp. PCC 7910 TaxID=2099387 RepID=UPI0014276FD1|nr:hypothetical protein [Tolypothrix sp. PCC 7910]QIR41015.1 hypothetical protein HCG51_32925 [Tolypothrix sp. PCC 7910]
MASKREAIIFIHGFYLGRDRNYFIDSLSTGLTEVLELPRVEEAGEEKIAGYAGKKFKVYVDVENIKEIDIYDAYWNDIISQPLSSSNLKNQIFRGVSMLFYWLISKDIFAFRNSPPLLIGLGVSLMLWIFWFYGIIALALVALGQDPNILGFAISEDWSKQISAFGKQMTNWSAWLIVSGLFSFVPINMLADIADFSTKYVEDTAESKILKAKIRKQVTENLNAVLESGLYEKITILAHSFGNVIATDVLADYQQKCRVRYISLGGSLKIFSIKSKQIAAEIKKCFNNQQIETWIDFYSHQDWLCTKTPVADGCDVAKISHREIKIPFSLIKQMSGKTHDHYFMNEEVLKACLNLKNDV